MPRRPRTDSDDPELRAVLDRLAGIGVEPSSAAEQLSLVAQVRERWPDQVPTIDRWLVFELNELRRTLRDVQAAQTELRKLHDQLTSPPWYTGVFIRSIDGPSSRAVVTYLNTPRVVTLAEGIDAESLAMGDDVVLSHDLNLLLEKLTPSVKRMSEVGEFQYLLANGRLVLKVHDAEVVVTASAALDLSTLAQGDRVLWDSGLAMAFERLPRAAESGFFLAETPTTRFTDIGGLDEQIERLQQTVGLHLRHPELVARYGLQRASSVLLVGPPGTGKTMLARAFAQWLGEHSRSGRSTFMYIKPGALHSMWWGQSEANYREVFRVARAAGAADPGLPVVMFFDEVDSIGATRSADASHQVSGRVLESLMTELDGLQARGNILVVAATNRREALDPALLRPGRLGDVILEVPRPRASGARAILERHLSPSAPYDGEGTSDDARQAVIDTAVSQLFAPNAAGDLASIMFRDGSRRPVHARDLVSGAMLANIARAAAERACVRDAECGEAGIRRADVLDAVADELANAVAALVPHNCHTHIAGLPQDLHVVRVESLLGRSTRPHRYLRVA